MKLVEILLARGSLSPVRLSSVGGYQNLEDEQLGTCLFEEGAITADQLAVALSVLWGVPPALDQDFARSEPGLRKRLQSHQAAKLKAIPLYTTPNRRVAVAMVNPTHPEIIEELGFILGVAIEPMVTSEPVHARQLELLYGLPRYRTTGFHPNTSQAAADGAWSMRDPILDEDTNRLDILPWAVDEQVHVPSMTDARRELSQRLGV